jgi:hypothetical protein
MDSMRLQLALLTLVHGRALASLTALISLMLGMCVYLQNPVPLPWCAMLRYAVLKHALVHVRVCLSLTHLPQHSDASLTVVTIIDSGKLYLFAVQTHSLDNGGQVIETYSITNTLLSNVHTC